MLGSDKLCAPKHALHNLHVLAAVPTVKNGSSSWEAKDPARCCSSLCVICLSCAALVHRLSMKLTIMLSRKHRHRLTLTIAYQPRHPAIYSDPQHDKSPASRGHSVLLFSAKRRGAPSSSRDYSDREECGGRGERTDLDTDRGRPPVRATARLSSPTNTS